jgi:hypothetical protein
MEGVDIGGARFGGGLSRSDPVGGDEPGDGAGVFLPEFNGIQTLILAGGDGAGDLVVFDFGPPLGVDGVIGFKAAHVALGGVSELEVIAAVLVAGGGGGHFFAVVGAFEEAEFIGFHWKVMSVAVMMVDWRW